MNKDEYLNRVTPPPTPYDLLLHRLRDGPSPKHTEFQVPSFSQS